MPKTIYTPKKSNPRKKTHDQYVAELAQKKPYIIVLEQYKNALTKILHRCLKCGNEWKVGPYSLVNIRSNCKCNRRLKNAMNHEEYVLLLNKHNPTIISLEKYTTGHTKILHRCLLCEHEWRVVPSSLKYGKRGCPKCYSLQTTSKGEKEVAAFIKEIYNGLVIENDRTILNPKELDVYLPEIGFAVEYNGDYWHSKKPKGYHTDKTTRCADQGIQLLHIWESDWKAGVELCKHKIQDALIFNMQFQS